MRWIDRKLLPFVSPMIWPIVFVALNCGRLDFRVLLQADFWISLGQASLAAFAGLAAIGAAIYAYFRFCRWFSRVIDEERARIDARVAAREGLVTWPASDPLHDPELDGLMGSAAGRPLERA